MNRDAGLAQLTEIAADQWGLLTRRQMDKAGIPHATLDRLIAGGSVLERVARGVYHFRGSPIPDHLELRAAWLQLAPETPVWARKPDQGVVSHRSAAALYGLGDLPADRHDFTIATRKQTRRSDVRLHIRALDRSEWIHLDGLIVTRPTRTAFDLLLDREEPEAVARIISEAIRRIQDYPGTFVDALAPLASQFGFARGDGLSFLRWLLDLVGDPDRSRWLEEAKQTRLAPRNTTTKAAQPR